MCAPVVQGYGLTETCAVSTCCITNEMSQAGTVGPPFPMCEMRCACVCGGKEDGTDWLLCAVGPSFLKCCVDATFHRSTVEEGLAKRD